MPFLEFATAQLSLPNQHSAALKLIGGDQRQPLGGSLSNFIIGNAKDSKLLLFKSFKVPAYNFGLRHLKMRRGRGVIESVAVFEKKGLVQGRIFEEGLRDDLQRGVDLEYVKREDLSTSGEAVEVEEKERLRRSRISKANKGNTPWNKGRRHSPETIQKIRERTRLAMQNPKVKMKLTNLGHAQSQETKLKIGIGVRMGWEKRRNKLKLQETCQFEWQNLIAESSRNGLLGQEELSWDSYRLLDEQLLKEWLQSVELRRNARKVKCDKRAPKSAEQKKRISLAISAKWNDPAYRNRVCSALAKYHGSTEESERKPKRKVSGKKPTASVSLNPTDSVSLANKDKSQTSSSRPRRSKEPSYKDPLVSSKLEMIKNIRAQRETADARKAKAIEQARLLIAEAEKAANALEVAARTNPVAQASLMEARKLIKEATKSLEFINIQSLAPVAGPKNPSYNSNKLPNDFEKERNSGNEQMNRTDQYQKLNIYRARAASEQNYTNLGTLKLQDMSSGQEKLNPYFNPDKYPPPLPSLGSPKGNVIPTTGPRTPSSPLDTPVKSQRSKKTWIKGRLVEVTESS